MSQLFDLVRSHLDEDTIGAIADRLGLDTDATHEATGLGLPALLGGMANHASSPSGAAELIDRVDRTEGGNSLGGLLDRLRGGRTQQDDDDEGLLGSIFGGAGAGGIVEALAGRLGFGGGIAKQLLGALVPLVIGALGKLGGGHRFAPARLSGLLQDATSAAADAAPGGRSAVAGLLGPLAAGAGLAAAPAAAGTAGAGSAPATAAAAAPSAEPPAGDEPQRNRRAGGPWWLAGAGTFVLGLIVAFAGGAWGSDTPKLASGSGTTTEQTPTETTPATPTGEAGQVSATSDGTTITLSGAVPDDPTKSGLGEAAAAVVGAANVTNNLEVAPGAGAGASADGVGRVLTALKGLAGGWTALWTTADSLTLSGTVPTEADKTAIVDAATTAFAPGTVVDELTVAGGAAPAAAIDEINKEIRLRGVNFVTGSASLTPASRVTLNRVARILSGATAVRAEVQGHTDSQGNAAANLALSRRRAASVVAYLVGRGIARDRLSPKGFGQAKPIASNATESGRARNRRVVFVQLGG